LDILNFRIFLKCCFLFSIVLTLGACGDKTLEEHQRDELERHLAELLQVEGRYTGLVRSRSDNSIMGALALDIRVETRSNGSPGTGRAEGQATLVTSVEFVDYQKISISSSDGYFDARSKHFQTNISIARSGSGPEDLSIGGRLDGSKLSGSMGVTGYTAFRGLFDLIKGGQDPEILVRGKLPQEDTVEDGLVYSRSFKGQTTFRNNRITPLQLIVSQQSLSSGEDFMNKFVPVKSVEFTLNYGNGLSIIHTDARWDQRTGHLTGQWSPSGSGPDPRRITSECRQTGQAANMRWQCTHSSSSVGQVASTVAVDMRDPQEFDTDSFTEQGRPVRANFVGNAVYGRNASQSTQAAMVVTLPAESRDSQILQEFFPNREKAVYAALQLFTEASADFTLSFPAATTVWDSATGLLNGTMEKTTSNDRVIFSLQCQDFHLDRTSQTFRCEYISSRLLHPFLIDFRPSER
jgi:hypothetical protein